MVLKIEEHNGIQGVSQQKVCMNMLARWKTMEMD